MKIDMKQSILYLAIMGMEVCWLYVLISVLNSKVAGGQLSAPGILVLYPVSLFFNRLLDRLRLPKMYALSTSLLGWILSMLLIAKTQLYPDMPFSNHAWLLQIPLSIARASGTVRPEFIVIAGTGIAWWLGQHLASRDVTFPIILRKFQFGLIILVLIFFTGSRLEALPDNTIPIAPIFFFFALFGISIAHTFKNTDWMSGHNHWPWSGLLIVSVSLILLLGFLATVIITSDLLQLLMTVIKWGWALMSRLILTVIEFLARLFPRSEPGKLPPMLSPPLEHLQQGKPLYIPRWLRRGLLFTISIFCIGMVLLALWRVTSDVYYRLRRRLADLADAEIEPMTGAFRADLLCVLKLFVSKLIGILFLFRVRQKEDAASPEAVSIRRIYRQLLRWAAGRGFPRHISQTPYEYCRILENLLPDIVSELGLITQQYVRARYGVLQSEEETLETVSRAWQRIKQAGLKRA
jgi:hypothetical protein